MWGAHAARKTQATKTEEDPARDTGNAILIGQSKLQRQLNVSPMTFWRWLHGEKLAFPERVRINNRVYFPVVRRTGLARLSSSKPRNRVALAGGGVRCRRLLSDRGYSRKQFCVPDI